MYHFPIGCFLESFKQDKMQAVKTAVSIGMQGVQVCQTDASVQERKEFFRYIKDNGLIVSAVCGGGGNSACASFSFGHQNRAVCQWKG